MPNVNSVLYNVNQDFPETSATGASKARARANIGAASAAALDAETARAQAAEGAARTEVVQGDGIRVERTQGASGQNVYTISNNGQGVFKRVQAPVNQSFNAHACITGFTQDAQGVGQVAVEYLEDATQSASGLMSVTDKTKLDGVESGAEVNQNAFSNVKVGSTTIAADSKTDTLELVAGTNVTLTPDATNDTVTFAAIDTTYTAGAGIGISNQEISRKIQYVTPSNTYSKIRSIIDNGDQPVLEITAGSYHNYLVCTHKSGTHIDFIGNAQPSLSPGTPDGSQGLIKVSVSDSNQWTITQLLPENFGTAGQALVVNSAADGTEWATLNTVPDPVANRMLVTDSNGGMSWDSRTIWRPGFNTSGRASGDPNAPYLDCNYVVKNQYLAPPLTQGTAGGADVVRTYEICAGFWIEITYKSRASSSDTNALQFRYKIDTGSDMLLTGTHQVYIGTDTPTSWGFHAATTSANSYVYAYSRELSGGLHKWGAHTGSDEFFEGDRIWVSWTNTHHMRQFAYIAARRAQSNSVGVFDILAEYSTYGYSDTDL